MRGLIAGVLGGAARGYTQMAEGELKKQQELDLRTQLMEAETEKQLRIDEIKRNRDVADIPRKAEATAAAAPILARGDAAAAPIRAEGEAAAAPIKARGEAAAAPIRAEGEAAAAPIKARGEAQGQIAKTSTPGYTKSLQDETDAKVSRSQKAYYSARVNKMNKEIEKIANDISVGNVSGTSRDRLTTIVNTANDTIKSLNEGSRGRTAEEKAEWKRQMDAAIALRNKATSLLNENLEAPRPSGGSATSGPTTNRPPLSQFNR